MNTVRVKIRQPLFDISFIGALIFGAVVVLLVSKFLPSIIGTVSMAAIVICFGFGLPRWIGLGARKQRSEQAKQQEIEKWGFCSRDREGPWLNYIDYPLVKKSRHANNKRFYSEWLIIHDGLIIVNPGPSIVCPSTKSVVYDYTVKRTYAWDGCTPKRFFFWFALFGTPDWWQRSEKITTLNDAGGFSEKKVFWQLAHHASLVHDALYQYLDSIPISKRDVDRQFHEMLLDSDMPRMMAALYHLAVRFFGASDVGEVAPKKSSELVVSHMPLTTRPGHPTA